MCREPNHREEGTPYSILHTPYSIQELRTRPGKSGTFASSTPWCAVFHPPPSAPRPAPDAQQAHRAQLILCQVYGALSMFANSAQSRSAPSHRHPSALRHRECSVQAGGAELHPLRHVCRHTPVDRSTSPAETRHFHDATRHYITPPYTRCTESKERVISEARCDIVSSSPGLRIHVI